MFGITNYSGFGAAAAGTSPPTPPPTTGLYLWNDFSNAASLTTSGSRITTASDLSGNGNYTTNTSTKNPTYSANVQNGLGAALFGGTGTTIGRVENFGTDSSPYSVSFSAVARTTASDFLDLEVGLLDLGVLASPYFWYSLQSLHHSPKFTASQRNTGTLTCGTQTGVPGWAIYVYSGGSGLGSSTARVDGGVFNGSGAADTTSTNNPLRVLIGDAHGQTPWLGYVGEVRVFKNAIGTDDIFKEEGYLAWKWGLQGNLPSDHPYKNAPP